MILKPYAICTISGALVLKTIFTLTTLKGQALLVIKQSFVYIHSTEIALNMYKPVFHQFSSKLSHIFVHVSNTAKRNFKQTASPVVKNSF